MPYHKCRLAFIRTPPFRSEHPGARFPSRFCRQDRGTEAVSGSGAIYYAAPIASSQFILFAIEYDRFCLRYKRTQEPESHVSLTISRLARHRPETLCESHVRRTEGHLSLEKTTIENEDWENRDKVRTVCVMCARVLHPYFFNGPVLH